MFCQKCGAPILEQSKFCKQCGNKIKTEPRISNKAMLIAAIAAIVSVSTALFGLLPTRSDPIKAQGEPSPTMAIVAISPSPRASPSPRPTHKPKPTPEPTPESTPTPTPEPEPGPPAHPRAVTIMRDSFTLSPGFFVSYPVPPNPKGLPIRIAGHFEAQGGSGNDIEVYILDDDGLTNFKNRHSSRTYYNSGRATVGDIHAVLVPRGQNYYVVFSNTFSVFAAKGVGASVVGFYLGE